MGMFTSSSRPDPAEPFNVILVFLLDQTLCYQHNIAIHRLYSIFKFGKKKVNVTYMH